MSDKPDGGPAFPCEAPNGDFYSGMDLRDYFAGQALLTIQVSASEPDTLQIIPPEVRAQTHARLAYALADAMLAERSKP